MLDPNLVYKSEKMGPLRGIIKDALFVDREHNAWLLFNYADLVARQIAMSTVFASRRRLGKTELLKRFYNVLFWKQDKVVPIYYYMKREHLPREVFGLKFIENFFMQYLAFKNKDPKLLTKKLTIDDLVAMVESSGDEGLQSVVDGYKSHVKYNDYAGLLEVAIYADEMTLKGEPYPAGGAFGEVVESTRAPYLVSGSSMTLLNKTLSNDCFFMRFDRFKLDPLEDHDAYELVKRLSNYFKVKVSEKTAAMIIGKCKGNPFYIKCIFQQANKQKSNLET
ncbi:MAG: hypothetical protein ACE5J3_13335 [Methanosarcinales archaeon]